MQPKEFLEKAIHAEREVEELMREGLCGAGMGVHLTPKAYKSVFPESPEGCTVKDQSPYIRVSRKVDGIEIFCLTRPAVDLARLNFGEQS
jgi:hypothetical protein